MEKFIKKSNKPSKIFLEYLNTSKYNTSYFNIGDVFVFKNEFQFIEVQEHIQSSLTKIFPLSLVFILQEELVVKTSSKYVRPLLIIIKRHTPRSYQQLIDITAVDHPKQKQRFEIVYQLLSVKYNQRLMLSVSVSEGIMLDTVTSIYASAGWYEREIWDMFGIFFRNHTDLRRILTDYGFKGHPLRKDFPITGYVEVRYSDYNKRVVYEKVNLSQEYRRFSLENNWQ